MNRKVDADDSAHTKRCNEHLRTARDVCGDGVLGFWTVACSAATVVALGFLVVIMIGTSSIVGTGIRSVCKWC